MSFFSITDPVEREKVVKEYAELVKYLHQKAEDQRSDTIHSTLALEKRYAPIVQSQKQMSDQIVKELQKQKQRSETKYDDLVPVKTESNNLVPVKAESENLEPVKKESKERKLEETDNFGHMAEEYRQRYSLRDPDIDTQFGINFLSNGQTMIGNTPITIDGDDIIIAGNVYEGTEGLWTLLTEKNKEQLENRYYKDDIQQYMGILKDTAALHQNFDPENNRPRSNQSYKWRKILSVIWKKIREDEGLSDDEYEDAETQSQ